MNTNEFWTLRFHKEATRPAVAVYWFKCSYRSNGVEVVDSVDCHLTPLQNEMLWIHADVIQSVHRLDYIMSAGWWRALFERCLAIGKTSLNA